MGKLGSANQVHGNGDNNRERQHGKREAMSLAHAKGSTDVTHEKKVDHTGDNSHMQSIANGTNRMLGQLVNKQHGQRHATSNTQPPTQRRRHIRRTTQINPLPSKTSNYV